MKDMPASRLASMCIHVPGARVLTQLRREGVTMKKAPQAKHQIIPQITKTDK